MMLIGSIIFYGTICYVFGYFFGRQDEVLKKDPVNITINKSITEPCDCCPDRTQLSVCKKRAYEINKEDMNMFRPNNVLPKK